MREPIDRGDDLGLPVIPLKNVGHRSGEPLSDGYKELRGLFFELREACLSRSPREGA